MHEVPASLVDSGINNLQEEGEGITGAASSEPAFGQQVLPAVSSSGSSSSSKISKSKILVALKAKLRQLQQPPSSHPLGGFDSKKGCKKMVWKRTAAVSPLIRKAVLLPLHVIPSAKPSLASRSPGVFRVCYLFAGPARKADIRASLEELCMARGMALELSEIDLCYGAEHDMSDEAQWLKVRAQLEAGNFDTVIITPPCSTYSRAPWANKKGPKPVRSRAHPWGFPWLRGWQRRKADLGSLLVQRALEAARCAWEAGSSFLLEHPEDLGRVPAGEPASIWQLEETFAVVADTDAVTGALHQCQWPDLCSAKPTRLAGTVANLVSIVHPGWPKFTATGHYAGPLPRFCGHNHAPLIGGDGKGGFRTGPSAAYPPAMCQGLAKLLLEDFLIRVDLLPKATTPVVGVILKSRLEVEAEEELESDVDEDGVIKPPFGSGLLGFGRQLSIKVNGKEKPFEDGAGICSPGRWPPERRGIDDSGFAWELRAGFLRMMFDTLDVKKVLFGLACGHSHRLSVSSSFSGAGSTGSSPLGGGGQHRLL